MDQTSQHSFVWFHSSQFKNTNILTTNQVANQDCDKEKATLQNNTPMYKKVHYRKHTNGKKKNALQKKQNKDLSLKLVS